MTTALDIRNVTYSYSGAARALSDVSTHVRSGEIVGLVGPNGSGKSTLIKLAFDLLAAQHGRILVNGAECNTPEARASAIYLASNDYLPQFLTGSEYIRSLASVYGADIPQTALCDAFDRFAMAGREGDLIEDYSHGMRKKTQLISAFLLDPPLTVIDETLNGIDLEALHLVERELSTLRDAGRAVLLCTHDFPLLERVADRVVFLDRGQLILDSPTTTLRDTGTSLADVVFEHLDRTG